MTTADRQSRSVKVADTSTSLRPNAVHDVSAALNALLADVFALYLKTKNFHWHVFGPHFRDYHLLLDEQGEQIFATTDAIAERVRKIGGSTLRSIGHIGRLQRVLDNDADFVTPLDMLAELRDDNKQLAARGRRWSPSRIRPAWCGHRPVATGRQVLTSSPSRRSSPAWRRQPCPNRGSIGRKWSRTTTAFATRSKRYSRSSRSSISVFESRAASTLSPRRATAPGIHRPA